MAAWNCNGSMKLDVGAFEDSFKGRDIIFYSETHQDRGGTLPRVTGYHWETTCRQEVSQSVEDVGQEVWQSYSERSCSPSFVLFVEMSMLDICGSD